MMLLVSFHTSEERKTNGRVNSSAKMNSSRNAKKSCKQRYKRVSEDSRVYLPTVWVELNPRI